MNRPAGATAAPVPSGERVLAPDLARGLALLGIAVANGVTHLFGSATGPGLRPEDGSGAGRATDFVVSLLIDNRAYPLFALLLGYGTVQLLTRQAARQVPLLRTRVVLIRRGLGLLLFGLVHAALLYAGDILGLYGLLSLLLVLLVGSTDQVLRRVAAGCLVPLLLLSAFDGASAGPQATDPSEADGWLAALAYRLLGWTLQLVTLPVLGIGLLVPMVVGVLMARRGLLDRPAEHLGVLRRIAVSGLGVGLLGGVPFALVVAQVWAPGTAAAVALAALHGLSGAAMGVGYAALFGLWAARADAPLAGGSRAADSAVAGSRATGMGVAGSRPVPSWLRPLAATGERSLTAYLAQSVLFVPLLAPWALGLGDDLGTAATALLSVGVWLATVLLCVALDRFSARGPAESLLRRIAYGRLR